MEISTLDYHTAGEPLRIVTGGLPRIPGASMVARRRHAREHLDQYRKFLMWEPRGHADMYGAILTESDTPGADVGILFLHNEGYSTMCGHGIIALVTAAVEEGIFSFKDENAIGLDTPAGLIQAAARRRQDGQVEVSFLNVPSFVLEEEVPIRVRGQEVPVTVAFGGAFYGYVDADEMGLPLEPGNASAIIALGREIKKAVTEARTIHHPDGEPDLGFLYGVIFTGAAGPASHSHSRNVCVFADGELDRSPTGTGVSGRAAIHHARGELALGESITIESILGTSFSVRCMEETLVGGLPAVVTEVSGQAYRTGSSTFTVSEHDPLGEGFFIR